MFYVAAIVGAVVSFFIGCLWYTALFGKKWQALMGFSDERVKKIFIPRRILCAFLCEWFSAACLTGLLTNLPINLWLGALMAAVVVVFSGVKLGIFDGKNPALLFINAGYTLLSVVVMTASSAIFL
jgi:hypothetical protein